MPDLKCTSQLNPLSSLSPNNSIGPGLRLEIFVKPIPTAGNGNATRSPNQTNFGGTFPKAMLRNLTVKHLPSYVKTFTDAIKISKEANSIT